MERTFKISKSDLVIFPSNGEFRKDFGKFDFGREGTKVNRNMKIDDNYVRIAHYINALRRSFVSEKTIECLTKYLNLLKEGKDYHNLLLFRGVRPWKTFKVGDIICDHGIATKTCSITYANKYTSLTHGVLFIIYYPGKSYHFKFNFTEYGIDLFGSAWFDQGFKEFITYPGEIFKIVDEGNYNGTQCFYLRYIGNRYCPGYQPTSEGILNSVSRLLNPKIESLYRSHVVPLSKMYKEKRNQNVILFNLVPVKENGIHNDIMIYRYHLNDDISDDWCMSEELDFEALIYTSRHGDSKHDNRVEIYQHGFITSAFYSGMIRKLYKIEEFYTLFDHVTTGTDKSNMVVLEYVCNGEIIQLRSGEYDIDDYHKMDIYGIRNYPYYAKPSELKKFFQDLFNLRVTDIIGLDHKVLPTRIL